MIEFFGLLFLEGGGERVRVLECFVCAKERRQRTMHAMAQMGLGEEELAQAVLFSHVFVFFGP